MILRKLLFGNPTLEQSKILTINSYLDDVLPKIKMVSFPQNDSDLVIAELNQLAQYSKLLDYKHNENVTNRYVVYDTDMITYFREELSNIEGLESEQGRIKNIIDNVINDVYPIITKAKYHFQRPRPYQLAAYHNIPLFPYKSKSVDSPSFPSGHATMGKVVCEVVGLNYPSTYGLMDKVSTDFSNSRQYMGLHYDSDIKAGLRTADIILSNRDFIKKYSL
jgi:hypothetical protein